MIRIGWISLLLLAALLSASAFLNVDGSRPDVIEKVATPLFFAEERTEITPRNSDLVARILERPLFNPSRRPTTAGESDHAHDIDTDATAKHQKQPRLAGIAVSGRGRSALFVGVENGQSIIVSEGSRIGDELVIRIEPGKVTLNGPSGVREMRTVIDTAQPQIKTTQTDNQARSSPASETSPRLGRPRQSEPPALQPTEE